MNVPIQKPEFGTKTGKYQWVHDSIVNVCTGEKDLIANLANATAILKENFDWWWTGFYLVKENELVLGPFQGPVACTRIAYGRGVCGSSWQQKKSMLVPDVHAFPGHIACSAASNSELVVPVLRNGEVLAVLDADSEHFSHFDATDQQELEKICAYLATLF
ncbi:MAG: GAF domain-containing protein [Bacteroidetes bacterium]|nr:GAF domain-containing protein [Bacteroidota bacterium]